MDPIYVLFAATGVMFWLILLFASVFIVASVENDSPGWATTTVAFTLGVLYFFSDFAHRYTFRFDLRIFAAYVVGYACVGIFWSVLKWYMTLSARRELWDEAVSEYRKTNAVSHGVTTASLRQDEHFINFLTSHYAFEGFVDGIGLNRRVDPRPQPNKPRIVAWMVYWPWSVLWSLFDDFITGFFRWVYRQLRGIYEGMSNYMFRDVFDSK